MWLFCKIVIKSNVRVDRRIFYNENDQEIFKLATLLMIEIPLFLMQIGNVWQKNHIICFICNALHLFWKCH